MVSNFALLSNLLLAAAALAVPSSSPVGVPRTPSHETRQSSNPNQNFAEYWTGASIVGPNGTFASVSASFDAPAFLKDESNGTLSFWTGIDGGPCSNRASILRAGVRTTFVNGQPKYDAWASWNTNDPHYFTRLTIEQYNTITITVVLMSDTSGRVFIQNEDGPQVVQKKFTADPINALCGSSVEWVVDSSILPNVGGLILTRTYASGYGSSNYVYKPHNPQDGTVFRNMTQNGEMIMATLLGPKESLGFVQSVLLDAVTGG